MSDELLDANLQDLIRQYRTKVPEVDEAVHLLQRTDKPESWFSNLLRHYSDGSVTKSKEIERREAVDSLLEYYSLLELACIAKFVRQPFDENMAAEMKVILHRRPVRRYYEVHFPLELVRSLRLRLEGWHAVAEFDRPASAKLFLSLLGIVNEFQRDEDIGWFLWLMDEFYVDDIGWPNVEAIIRSPGKYVRCIQKPPRKQTVLHEAVHGFRKFLAFCVTFERLLAQAKDLPLLRAAMWHLFAYWFNNVEERLEPAMRRHAQKVAEIAVKRDRTKVAIVDEGMKTWVRTLSALCDGANGAALTKAIDRRR